MGQIYHVPKNRSYTQVEAMLEKEASRSDHSEMQCATIITSNNYRFSDALNALKVLNMMFSVTQHGIHVMCQSPICFTEGEAITLYNTASSNGLVFHIANPYCFYGMIQIVHTLHSFDLGTQIS